MSSDEIMIIMLTTLVQPYAGLLPPRVLEPGKAVGTITDQMAQLTGLPTACTVCAGTSGLQCSLRLLLPYVQQLSLSSFGCMLLMKYWYLRLLLHNIKDVLFGRMLSVQTHCSVGMHPHVFLASRQSKVSGYLFVCISCPCLLLVWLNDPAGILVLLPCICLSAADVAFQLLMWPFSC
jgi:hypothetical protein